MDRLQVALETLRVALERQHIAQHEADRVVQFVCHARHQAAERDHLFGMQQLTLSQFQVIVRLAQGLIRLAQLAHRAAGDHHPHQLAGLRDARRAVHRHRNRRPVAGAQEELPIVYAILAEAGKSLARSRLLGVVGEKVVEWLTFEFGCGLASEVAKRGVHLDDKAVAVAGDQDVRHRAQHALDELLRLLERGVLVLKRHFVLEQVVVNLIHLLDDLDPGLLAEGGRRRVERVVSGRGGSGHAPHPVHRAHDGVRPEGRSD